jgi:tRNA (guanine-N7-)-methyltransferase
MGRRVLPKRDPNIDFSAHLVALESLPVPWDPQSCFPVPQDLEIEVGSGKGLFLVNQSARRPDRNYLGNEISRKYARFAAYRLAQQQRANARMVQGDGLKLFHQHLPDRSAVAVHVYFPDPWWKARHRRRRVMQPEFLVDIQRVLKPQGILHFWTDVEEYFEETCQLVRQHTDFGDPMPVPVMPAENDLDYRTHFERRMRLLEHDVFRAEFHFRNS